MKVAVVFFAFNRPDKLSKTLNSYMSCKDSDRIDRYIIIDGPRQGQSDNCSVEKCQEVAERYFNISNIIRRSKNVGLKQSIYDGISMLFKDYDALIIVEDDLILSVDFLNFMLDSLVKYQFEKKIYQISGFSYIPSDDNRPYFMPVTTSWGWATWRDRWQSFDIEDNNDKFLNNGRRILKFDLFGSYPFFRMLKMEHSGKISSWAIRWYYYVFKNEGIVLYPPSTLVINDGFDNEATHSTNKAKLLFGNMSFGNENHHYKPHGKIQSSRKNLKKLIFFFYKMKLVAVMSKLKGFFDGK